MPLIGFAYSKENTKQLFDNLYLEDPTFATEKFKRYQRKVVNDTVPVVECSKAEDGWKIRMRATHGDVPKKLATVGDEADPKCSTLSREKPSETLRSRQKSEISNNHRYKRPIHESGLSSNTSHIALKSQLKFSGSRQYIPSMTGSTQHSIRQRQRPRTGTKRDLQSHKFSNEILLGASLHSTTNNSGMRKARSR